MIEGHLGIRVAAFLLALLAVVAVAAWTDVRARRIPNWLCALNLVLGLSYTGFAFGGSGGGWPAVGWAALHVVVALVVTIGLFSLGIIGAGDAKFYASMAAWMPIASGLTLLVAVALSGFVLLVLFLAYRLPGRSRRDPAKAGDFDKLPYGIAIGVGGIAAVVLS